MVVYQIRNKLDNNIYIGSTVNFSKRKSLHLCELRKNRHSAKYLQNTFNKYGEDNFVFEVLEIIEDKEQLVTREQFYIDKLNPKYNYHKTAVNHIGKLKRTGKYKKNKDKYKITEEHKNKIRQSLLGKKHTKERCINISKSKLNSKAHENTIKGLNEKRQRKIVKDNNTGLIYNTMKEAANALGISTNTVRNNLDKPYTKNKRKYSFTLIHSIMYDKK